MTAIRSTHSAPPPSSEAAPTNRPQGSGGATLSLNSNVAPSNPDIFGNPFTNLEPALMEARDLMSRTIATLREPLKQGRGTPDEAVYVGERRRAYLAIDEVRSNPGLVSQLSPDEQRELLTQLVVFYNTLDDEPGLGLAVVFTLLDLFDANGTGPELLHNLQQNPEGERLLGHIQTLFVGLDQRLSADPEATRAWVQMQTESFADPNTAGVWIPSPHVPVSSFGHAWQTVMQNNALRDGSQNVPPPGWPMVGGSGGGGGAGFPERTEEVGGLSRLQQLLILAMGQAGTSREREVARAEQALTANSELNQTQLTAMQARLGNIDKIDNVLTGLMTTINESAKKPTEDFRNRPSG